MFGGHSRDGALGRLSRAAPSSSPWSVSAKPWWKKTKKPSQTAVLQQKSNARMVQMSQTHASMLDDIVNMAPDEGHGEHEKLRATSYHSLPPRKWNPAFGLSSSSPPPFAFSSSSSSSGAAGAGSSLSQLRVHRHDHLPHVSEMSYDDMSYVLSNDLGLFPDGDVNSKTVIKPVVKPSTTTLHDAVVFQQSPFFKNNRATAMLSAQRLLPAPGTVAEKDREVERRDQDIAALDVRISALMGHMRLHKQKDARRPRDISDKIKRDGLARKTKALKSTELVQVNQILSCDPRTVVVDAHNIELTGELMRCLRPLTWLNDEVINLYMELLRVRNNRKPDSLKCHFFNSFFYTKMLQGGYQYKNVRRWSKRAKIKVIEMDRVFVPINVNNSHWVLAVINFSEKRFEYHDSLYGNGSACLRQLRQYVADEANHYHDGMQYDFTGWTSVNIRDCPSQHNGSDCGVFTCKNADYLSDSREALFTQSDINYFRRRMVLELHNKFIQ